MSALDVAILKTGLVTSVGLSAPATCAALRAKLTNPSETRCLDSNGDWIMAHQVSLDLPVQGLAKLVKMAVMAIDEVLEDTSREEWSSIPLLLCVAESERAGRLDGLNDQLFLDIQADLGVRFSPLSAIVTHGRVSVAVALAQARQLLANRQCSRVVIAAADSLLTEPTLNHYERQDRILTSSNSNGFMPGEGAGALLVSAASGNSAGLLCKGAGFAREAAHIESGEPLRGEGLSEAIKAALADAGSEMHHMDFRITDLSGEHYYFKEASLALSRTLRQRKEEFDLWHPAECTGEPGAVAGIAMIALADAACRKTYSKGPNILAHMSNDAGQRAALCLQFRGMA